MPPREDELPEGTDQIINGAMETGGGGIADDDIADSGGASSGFIGASGSGGTGGTAASAGGTGMTTGQGTGGGGMGGDMSSGSRASGSEMTGGAISVGGGIGADGGNVTDQVKGQIYNLRDQAGGKVREFADTGKTRATDMLEELSRIVADTADSIDERLGSNYGEYARKAADGVSGFADNLRGKEVDELYDDVRSAVRKSPGLAIGIAAVVGFTLVRLVKAGVPDSYESKGSDGRRTGSGSSGA